jgi:hypothetical protein
MDLLSEPQQHQPPEQALQIPGPLVQRQVSDTPVPPFLLLGALPIALRSSLCCDCSLGCCLLCCCRCCCCQVLLWSQSSPRVPLVYAASWWASASVDK